MKLVIRVDGGKDMGTGHLMRCIALGEGFVDNGGEVVFIINSNEDVASIIERIKSKGFVVKCVENGGIEETLKALEEEAPERVVMDGYHFTVEDHEAVKALGCTLMVIDDFANLDYYNADIILNQNYGADKFNYKTGADTKVLLGPEYALLRSEFCKDKGYERTFPDVAKKLLITMGGADPDNYTLKVLRAMSLIEHPLDVRVVLGSLNSNIESVTAEGELSRHNVELLCGVDDMPALMAWADLALSAGGTTTWELAFMGLPSILCIVADNQEGAVNALSTDNVFVSIGWIKDKTLEDIAGAILEMIEDKELRERLSKRGRELVDGLGGKRVAREIATLGASVR
jgi:UDP-2,4-diacetamido-2,4,6-trideoxy-beta-L-altropyranose hydrolase